MFYEPAYANAVPIAPHWPYVAPIYGHIFYGLKHEPIYAAVFVA